MLFFNFFQSNRRHGHIRRLLAAGTKAIATLPDGTQITGASLNTALEVLASVSTCVCVCMVFLCQNVTKLAQCPKLLFFLQSSSVFKVGLSISRNDVDSQ